MGAPSVVWCHSMVPSQSRDVAGWCPISPSKPQKLRNHQTVRIDHHDVTTARLQQMKTETTEDPVLSTAWRFALDGSSDILCIARIYWDPQDELSTGDGILMKGHCPTIPTTSKEKTLHNLHVGHKASQPYKELLTTVCWPGIDADIQDLFNRCPSCLMNKPNLPYEKMLPHDITDAPWEKLAMTSLKIINRSTPYWLTTSPSTLTWYLSRGPMNNTQ